MQQTMKAIGFQEYGSADVLQEFQLPIPQPAENEVLIRVAAVGINPADWMFRKGDFRFFIRGKFPFIPGADVAGEIIQAGNQVRQFQQGDLVYAMLPTTRAGGYAEYVIAKVNEVALTPRSISLMEAAAVPLTALTALQALRDRAEIKAGMRVLINGASGGVGSFAVQIAKAMGAAHITGVASGGNEELVRSLGADAFMDYTRTDVLQTDARFDVIFDTIWNHTFWQWKKLLNANGIVVSVNPIAENPINTLRARLSGSQRLKSVLVKASGTDLNVVRDWIDEGKIRPVIDQPYPLTQAVDAQKYSESKHVRGKLVLVVDEELASQRPMDAFQQIEAR